MENLNLKKDMSEKQLSIVNSELENQKKSMLVAYLIWFFLGGLGVHRFYVGKTGSGVAMLGLWVLGMLTTWILFIGFFFLFVVYVWAIIDAFLLHAFVNTMNQKTERRILNKVANM